MNLDTYNKAKQFVLDSFNKIGKTSSTQHFLRTVDWLKELKPDADEALHVAAIAHDIERAFRKKDVSDKIESIGFTDVNFYRPHEERGSEIIADFLKDQKVNDSFIERVRMLVSRHEEGGNDDQNLLKDADSISYFETNIPHFLKRIPELGKEKIRDKFDWMFNRISSKKAKQIAKPLYKKAIDDLNNSL
jgi:hypothetical protein